MGVEHDKIEYNLFGTTTDHKEVILATDRTLEGIHGKYEMWKHSTIKGEYHYISLRIQRVTRAVIRQCTFTISIKEE